MELDWTTVALELVNFGVLMALLTRFLFKPVRQVLRDRKAELERAQLEAETARAEGASAKEDYERRALALQAEADAARKQATSEGEEAAHQLVEDARDEMRRARAAFELELERARGDAVARLHPELIGLAIEAGRRVLREIEASDVALGFARVGATKLREELAGHPTGHAAPPLRVKAHVSADADVYAVSLLLKEVLGNASVEVRVDPSIIGGVKLLADGLEVESSAGASLTHWLTERASTAAVAAQPAGVPIAAGAGS